MDPDAALKELLEAVVAGDCDRVNQLADGLRGWLSPGGYPPKTIGPWRLGQVWHVAMTHAIVKHALAHVRVVARQRKDAADAAP
jgi:hypothetical protein